MAAGEFARDIRQGEFGGFASYRHSAQLLTVRILPVHGTEHRAAIQKPTAVSTAGENGDQHAVAILGERPQRNGAERATALATSEGAASAPLIAP